MHCKFRVISGLGFITNLKGLLKNYRPSTSFCSGRPPNDLCFDQPSLFRVLYLSFGHLYFQGCFSVVVFKHSRTGDLNRWNEWNNLTELFCANPSTRSNYFEILFGKYLSK